MAGEDPKYLAWCRLQPCAIVHGCEGDVQAHHSTGGKGVGQRNSDLVAFPLCALHHRERHSLTGYFRGWVKQRIRWWESLQVSIHRAAYLGNDPGSTSDGF